jgi:hypothetical protein
MDFINELFHVIFNDPVILYPASIGGGALSVFVLIEYIIKVKEEIDMVAQNEQK